MVKHWVKSTRHQLVIIVITIIDHVTSHGRLIEPPSRSSMWRYGYNNPINYNDHELFCGGLSRQTKNGGKCGVCGDAWDDPQPRQNEAGGKYANGIIVKRYHVSQVIKIVVDITANHKGYFEFKLCSNNNPKREANEGCFDKHVLKLADGSGTRYYLPEGSKNEKFTVRYVLPKTLECSQCELQWTYTAGNNWGICKDGKEGMGCGAQETFRACADIAIVPEGAPLDNDSSFDFEDSNMIESDESTAEANVCRSLCVLHILLIVGLVNIISPLAVLR